MTPLLRAIGAIILFWPVGVSAVSAATVPLRSGEHDTFSRLVFADVSARAWTITRTGPAEVEINFSPGVPELDTETVFDRIPRTRLIGVSATGRRLTLALGCNCPVEVFQIPTGHVVIDVRDSGKLLPPISPPVPPDPAFPVTFPLPVMVFAPPEEPRPIVSVMKASVGPSGLDRPSQLRFHPSGMVPLLQFQNKEAARQIDMAACKLEPIAREALLADPNAALASIEGHLATLLDGQNNLDIDAVIKLSRIYLAAGWGAEAAQVARQVPADDGTTAVIAAALDDNDMPPGTLIDPGCGPATATIALLNRESTPNWNRSDLSELKRFLDRLDPVTWSALLPRLEARLRSLGDSEALSGLGPYPAPEPKAADSIATLAAGTDMTAVQAAITLLERSTMAEEAAAELHILNAVALLPSVPPGDIRVMLQQNLAAAFVFSRRPAEAAALAADGSASAETILALALRHLPAAESAEFAVRLRPYLPTDSEAARRAAEMFMQFGLEATVETFVVNERLPKATEPTGSAADPWIARDLRTMTAADPDGWTARNHLAQAILSRNATPLPQTDLAAAAEVLERSRTLSNLLPQLLVADPRG